MLGCRFGLMGSDFNLESPSPRFLVAFRHCNPFVASVSPFSFGFIIEKFPVCFGHKPVGFAVSVNVTIVNALLEQQIERSDLEFFRI